MSNCCCSRASVSPRARLGSTCEERARHALGPVILQQRPNVGGTGFSLRANKQTPPLRWLSSSKAGVGTGADRLIAEVFVRG
jgi:hypothetical protein